MELNWICPVIGTKMAKNILVRVALSKAASAFKLDLNAQKIVFPFSKMLLIGTTFESENSGVTV